MNAGQMVLAIYAAAGAKLTTKLIVWRIGIAVDPTAAVGAELLEAHFVEDRIVDPPPRVVVDLLGLVAAQGFGHPGQVDLRDSAAAGRSDPFAADVAFRLVTQDRSHCVVAPRGLASGRLKPQPESFAHRVNLRHVLGEKPAKFRSGKCWTVVGEPVELQVRKAPEFRTHEVCRILGIIGDFVDQRSDVFGGKIGHL